MATLSGKVARVKYTSSVATSSTGEAATRSTGTTGNGYVSINSTAKRHLNRNNSTAFKLYKDTVLQGSSLYDWNWVLGRAEYRSGDPAAGTWTMDVEYHTASYLAGAQSWTADINVDTLDVTSFSTSATDVQWRSYKPGLSQATVSLERVVSTGSTAPAFFDRLAAQTDVIVECWFDSNTKSKLEGWAIVDGDSYQSAVDGLGTESISLRIDDQLYFSTI